MAHDATEVQRWLAEHTRIWPTSCELTRWLDEVFEPPWPQDVRRDHSDSGHTVWSVPDYERGRSRSLTVERDVLRDFKSPSIVRALGEAGWQRRIESEDLLVRKAHDSGLEVVGWAAPHFEKWFWSPDHAEWFVAFQSTSGGVSTGGPPPPIQYFVAIHGKSYAAVGPEGSPDIARLELDAIVRHLPQRELQS